jgi:hypothetical protein
VYVVYRVFLDLPSVDQTCDEALDVFKGDVTAADAKIREMLPIARAIAVFSTMSFGFI